MLHIDEMLQVKDIFLTPIYMIFIYVIAMFFRKRVTTRDTIKYYIPALFLKVFGAIALGLLYTFYYSRGDTTSYYYHIQLVCKAFVASPAVGLELLLSNGVFSNRTGYWTNQMFWYSAPAEFMVVRIGTLLSLLSFSTYTVIAMLFALVSFTGIWAMFLTFLKFYPNLHRQFAIALFFMPSVFFWGSGVMKDSLCLGGLGWIFFAFYRGAIERRKIVQSGIIIIVAAYPVLVMKAYILLAFLPPALFWIVNEAGGRIRNRVLRRLLTPLFFLIGSGVAVVGLTRLTAGDQRFDLEQVAERARITSDYIYRVSVEQGGAAYNLGVMDGTIGGLVRMAPQAVNVTLFRPYLWEVRNPIMLLSAMEAALFFYLTLTLIWRTGFFKTIRLIASVPILQLCFAFAIIFSISVGLSTNNFGTLARYKVQMMPFYLSGLYIAQHLSQTDRVRRAQAFARA